MSKNIYGSLALVLLLNFVVKPLYIFGIDLTVQNKVGAAAFGNYFSILNLTLIFHAILELGIYNFNTKEVAKKNNFIAENFASIFTLKAFLSVLYFIIVFGFAFLINVEKSNYFLLFILLLNQIVLSYFIYLRTNISGLQKFKTDSFLSIADKSFAILIIGIFLFLPFFAIQFSTTTFAIGQLIASIIAFVIAFFLSLTLTKKIRFEFNFYKIKSIIKKSLPFASIALLMGIYFKTDAVMLERMLPNGKTQSGIYASGFRILDALNMIPILVAGILYPRICNLVANKKNYKKEFWNFNEILLFASIAATVLLLNFAKPILNILYTNAILEYINIFKVLILSFLPLSILSNFGLVLLANNKLNFLNIVVLLAAILNVLLNFVFIPKFEAIGAAFVTLTTQILVLFFYAYYVVFNLKLNWQLSKLISFVVFAIFNFAAVFLLSKHIHNFFLSFILSAVTIIFSAFVINITNVKQLKNFVTKPN